MPINADVLTGPFDPGGQPETRTGDAMELGFFAWNIKGGMTASEHVLKDPDRMQNFWEWPRASRLVQLAEKVGFDYQVPFARWIGQGGSTDYNGANLDFLASAAAMAPMTSSMGIFSTAHVTYRFHPLHFAKFGATIDHISNGRWGLNIVSGYAAREMAAFGFKEPIEHDTAYAMADEFTTLLKYLWTSDEPVNFEGQYYQAYGAMVAPKPTRKPRPVIMSAGNSDVGLDFACRQADWVFVTAPTLDAYRERIDKVKADSKKYGRDVRASTMVYVVMEPTDEQAQETLKSLEDNVDRVATLNFIRSMQSMSIGDEFGLQNEDEEDPWGGVGRETFLRIALGITAWQLVGGYQSIAEQIKELSEIGLESILMCFVDPLKGLHEMEDHVIPILKDMGLRK
jgi:FMNH2-dependent dimethyl sulfone monooxygenase